MKNQADRGRCKIVENKWYMKHCRRRFFFHSLTMGLCPQIQQLQPPYEMPSFTLGAKGFKKGSCVKLPLVFCCFLKMKFKNWFILGVSISSNGCMRKVWRTREKRKSCSRRSREQLQLLECSPNFPSAAITRYTHS